MVVEEIIFCNACGKAYSKAIVDYRRESIGIVPTCCSFPIGDPVPLYY